MNWKGCGRKRSWPNLRYFPSICLEGLRTTKNTVSQDSQSPGQDLNLGPTYEINIQFTVLHNEEPFDLQCTDHLVLLE
jgi:hypothetical protein